MAKPNQKITTRQEKTCTNTAPAQELQTEHRVVRGVTVEGITADLEKARQMANELGQAEAAVDACVAMARLHGLMIERTKAENSTGQDMTDQEIEERHRQIAIEHVRSGGRDYLINKIAESKNLLATYDAGDFEQWAAQGAAPTKH